MTGHGSHTAEPVQHRSPPPPATPGARPLGWLAAGGLAGSVVTAAVVFTLVAALRPEQPPAALDAPRMVEESGVAGVNHTYDGDFEYFVGGGVAVFDCNADGLPDLFFAGGENQAALFTNAGSVGGPLSFQHLPHPATDLTGVTGAYPIDIDSDGITDLAVLRVGENVALRGVGGCVFEPANDGLGLDGGEAWTAAFAATWEGDAALPTMLFGNYLKSSEDRTCADHALIRPGATGGYQPPRALEPGLCTLSALFSDWGRTGTVDLRLTNDRHYHGDGGDQLWRMGPDPVAYGPDDGWDPIRIWGMGIASQDLTGDGRPEVYLTSQGDNKLQTLTDQGAGPAYRDMALERGVTAHSPFAGDDVMPSTAWHAEFGDVNNDTFFDLFVSKGNVEAMPEFATDDPSNLLLGQTDGTFVEGAEQAGIVDFNRGRGAALADLNLDGMLDLIQVNRRSNVELWRNVGWGDANTPAPMGHWLAVRPSQPAPNPNAVGGWIEVRAGDRVTSRELTIGGGHAGGTLGWIHFGLGDATAAEVRIQWPDGETGPWIDVSADTHVVIERDATTPAVWMPGSE
ncbi:MAG: CRTAC1 family protein [Acidimicrobiia bacterium]